MDPLALACMPKLCRVLKFEEESPHFVIQVLYLVLFAAIMLLTVRQIVERNRS